MGRGAVVIKWLGGDGGRQRESGSVRCKTSIHGRNLLCEVLFLFSGLYPDDPGLIAQIRLMHHAR